MSNPEETGSAVQRGEHVFEGKPDARQQEGVGAPVSRFRPRYRELTPEEKQLHDQLKDKAAELEMLFTQVKAGQPGRYKALALTDLENSIMWIVKELTS
jgi:hypothetical protein